MPRTEQALKVLEAAVLEKCDFSYGDTGKLVSWEGNFGIVLSKTFVFCTGTASGWQRVMPTPRNAVIFDRVHSAQKSIARLLYSIRCFKDWGNDIGWSDEHLANLIAYGKATSDKAKQSWLGWGYRKVKRKHESFHVERTDAKPMLEGRIAYHDDFTLDEITARIKNEDTDKATSRIIKKIKNSIDLSGEQGCDNHYLVRWEDGYRMRYGIRLSDNCVVSYRNDEYIFINKSVSDVTTVCSDSHYDSDIIALRLSAAIAHFNDWHYRGDSWNDKHWACLVTRGNAFSYNTNYTEKHKDDDCNEHDHATNSFNDHCKDLKSEAEEAAAKQKAEDAANEAAAKEATGVIEAAAKAAVVAINTAIGAIKLAEAEQITVELEEQFEKALMFEAEEAKKATKAAEQKAKDAAEAAEKAAEQKVKEAAEKATKAAEAAAEQRVQSLQAQVDVLTEELQTARAHQREQAAALEQQTATLQDTQARLKTSEQALSDAKQQVPAAVKAEHQQLQQQLKQTRQKIAELEGQLENARRDIGKKTTQLDAAQQQLTEAKVANQNLSRQIHALSSSLRHSQPADSAFPAAVAFGAGAAAAAAVTTPPSPPLASPLRMFSASPPPASAVPPPPPITAAALPAALKPHDTQAPSGAQQQTFAAAVAAAALPPSIIDVASTATQGRKIYPGAPSIVGAGKTPKEKKAHFANAIKDKNAAIIGDEKDYYAAYFHLVSARNNYAARESGFNLRGTKPEFDAIADIESKQVEFIVNLNECLSKGYNASEHYKMVHCFAHLPVPRAAANLTALKKGVSAALWLNLYDVAIDMFRQEAITLTAFSCVHAVAAACFADADDDDALAKSLISQFEACFAEVEAILKQRELLALPATTTLPPPPPPPPPTVPAASNASATTTTTMPPPAPPAPPVGAASPPPKRAGATTTSTTTTGAPSPAAASAGAAGSRDALFSEIRAGQVSLRSTKNTPPPVTPTSDTSVKGFAKVGNMLVQARAKEQEIMAKAMQSRRRGISGDDDNDREWDGDAAQQTTSAASCVL